jgi:NTE family protein
MSPACSREHAVLAVSAAVRATPRVALVLPGGGARGAYEAGALSVLLPLLAARGEAPSIICGTSVGAINAAMLASLAHLDAETQAQAIVARWTALRRGDVVARVLGPASARTAVQVTLGRLGLPGGSGAVGLLDPSPLTRSLDTWVDWEGVHRNVDARQVGALCTVATSLERGGPVAFVETAGRVPERRPGEELAYVGARLSKAHVLASAAIPFVFPPVHVPSPAGAEGWFIDGGTRLNAPLKPALRLGADRVVVIGVAPFVAGPAAQRPANGRPSLGDVAANVLDGLLVDQVGADLHRLAAVNAHFVEGTLTSAAGAARRYRAGSGATPYRRISYALVAPEERGEAARLAQEAVRDRVGGLRALRDPEHALLAALLGTGERGAELLSFLLFDGGFAKRLVAAGRRDAQRWVDRHPGLWCADGAHDLDLLPGDPDAAREVTAVEEWRSLRGRR